MPSDRCTPSDEVVRELRDALSGAGVPLPSVGVDLVSFSDRTDDPPLISLGRCTVDTARALTAALKGASRGVE